MKFGSVCSGIEAASVAWESLGFEAQWFSEIEHFPSEVLKYRYPTVPNLGDMTKLFSNKTFLDSHIDLLVGGTPCQSFSVAGLRKGMEDPRGNLTLTFLSLIDIKKPKWIVWENVPGIISSNQGKDFQSFLDGLEEIGYICDVEILDAQYFGVAQRRRRVFVCGQSVDSILKERTITSALTIAQCLTEILHGILIEVLSLYEREPIKSDQASLSRDGVMRRMKLFGILTENCNYKNWQELLVEVFLKHHPVQKNWDLPLGEKSQKELTLEDLLMGLNQEGQSTLTEESLRKALEDLYGVMKLYTTLTLTKETIQSKISIFFQAGESISRLIARLSDSSPNSLSATLSSLTLLQELTNYARQTNSDIFSEMAGIYEVGDFLKQAQHRNAVIGYLGDWRPAAAVLFERESLSRDSKPSRKKGKETPTDAQGGVGATSPDGRETIGTLRARDYKGVGNDDLESGRGLAIEVKQVAQPIPINTMAVMGRPSDDLTPRMGIGIGNPNDPCPTLTKAHSHAVAQPISWDSEVNCNINKMGTIVRGGQGGRTDGVAQPIAFQPGNLARDAGAEPSTKTFPTLRANLGDQSPHVAQPIAVDVYNQTIDGQTSATLTKAVGGTNTSGPKIAQPISIAENTIGRQPMNGGNGDGFTEDGPMYTLNATGVHGVAQPIAYSFDSLASNSMKSSNPHSGCRKVETSKTIDTTIPEPSKNQGGIAIAQPKYFESHPNDSRVTGPHDVGNTVSARYGTGGGNTPLVSQPISLDCYNQSVTGDKVGIIREQHGTNMNAIAVDTYNQTINENTSQTIGSSASDVNHYGAVLEGNAFSHTFVNKGLNYAGAQERNTIKALSLLREKIGEKAFAQWGFGVFNSLQSTQILQSDLYGLGIRPASFSDSRFIYSPLSRKEDYSEWLLQSLREAGCEGCSSQGWELPKQLIAELRAYLSQLPYEKSSSKRLLQDLWESDERPWLLREALSKVQEVWQSNANKGQPTQRSCAIRRLTPFETEILQGFPRGWTKIPYRNKPADQCPDGPRYKACGNSMAVPVMRWIGQRIQLIDTILNG